MLTLELCFLIENLETEISALVGVSVKGNQYSVSSPPFFPHCKVGYNVSNLRGYQMYESRGNAYSDICYSVPNTEYSETSRSSLPKGFTKSLG